MGSDVLLFSRSGLTGIVNELERRGYVACERATDEARGIEAVVTEAGLSAFRRAHRVHLAGVRDLFLAPPFRGTTAAAARRVGRRRCHGRTRPRVVPHRLTSDAPAVRHNRPGRSACPVADAPSE